MNSPKKLKFSMCCVLLCSLSFVLCSSIGAEEKREVSQYEKRLQALANRYSHAKAGTVDFPQELLAVQYINEGFKFLGKNNYELAGESAKMALSYDPKSPPAHELAGDVAYLTQNLEDANQHYRAAFQIEPSPRLKAKLEKLIRETGTEKDLNTVEEVHFSIRFDRNQSEYEGFELRTILNDAYLGIAREMAHSLNHKTVVLFYDSEKFSQAANLPHWVGGLFDGKVRLPMHGREFGENQLKAVTRHEVTHVFLNDISRGKAPVWLHEGLAVYQQNKIDPLAANVTHFLNKPEGRIPFAELMDSAAFDRNKNNQDWVGKFYIQSYDVVSYLIDRYGMFNIKQLALSFGEGKGVEEAVQEVYKMSVGKMEREWIQARAYP